jgi:hypothetical protein
MLQGTSNPYVYTFEKAKPKARRMRVVNKTKWRTDQLKAFAVRAAKDELDPEKAKRLNITFVNTRPQDDRAYSSGLCYRLGGNDIVVRLHRKLQNKTDLAMVLAHEMAHARGMNHNQMRGNPRYRRLESTRELYAWAEAMPLEVKPKRAKTPVDIQAVRHQRILAATKRWETKLKRAQTALKKLRAQDRYYSRAMAAKAATPNHQHQTKGEHDND